jgi:hypothetical protein
MLIACVLRELQGLTQRDQDPNYKFQNFALQEILRILLRDSDDAVVNRLEEISAISDLLRRGAEINAVSYSDSQVELMGQTPVKAEHFRISVLDARLEAMRGELINLQTSLESMSRSEAKVLLTDVWAVLERSAKRNGAVMPPWF